MSTQAIKAIDAEIQRKEQELTKLREELAAIQPAAQGLALDAARWRMVVLISRETMTHPDKRTSPKAVAAYMRAVHAGLDIQGAIDAALAAQAEQGGEA